MHAPHAPIDAFCTARDTVVARQGEGRLFDIRLGYINDSARDVHFVALMRANLFFGHEHVFESLTRFRPPTWGSPGPRR